MNAYENDNDVMIGQLITKNWQLSGKKPDIYYDEGNDVVSHQFTENPVAIKVYIGDQFSTPQGISYDSERLFREVAIDVRGLNRADTINAKNEVRRILAVHRKYPGNNWDLIVLAGETRITQTYNFYHQVVTYTLKKYFLPLPDLTWSA